MWNDEYKKSVDGRHASEELIQKTLSRIKAQTGECEQSAEDEAYKQDAKDNASAGRFVRKRMTRWVAAAACFVLLAAAGTALLLQGGRIVYVDVSAPTVQGTMPFAQEDNAPMTLLSGLKRAELKGESELPEGLLSANTVNLGGIIVYFGFEAQTATCYAAYREADKWELLYSSTLSKNDFTQAVRDYLEKNE